MSEKDYIKLYKLQDKAFNLLSGHYGNLYLTGGTALGRFYFDHRYSDDIDLFTHSDSSFQDTVKNIRQIIDLNFKAGKGKPVLYDDFIRVWLEEDDCQLKIEFVNDVPYHWGDLFHINNIPIDNPGNILSNKLTCVAGRDEPKDVSDIITISLSYSFNWAEVFEHSIRKAIVAEQNVAERLQTFPIELFENQVWLKHPMDLAKTKILLETIADDFLFAKDNSLGKNKIHITQATPRK